MMRLLWKYFFIMARALAAAHRVWLQGNVKQIRENCLISRGNLGSKKIIFSIDRTSKSGSGGGREDFTTGHKRNEVHEDDACCGPLALMIPAKAASGPTYNPAAAGTVTPVRVRPPLAGVHVMTGMVRRQLRELIIRISKKR